MLLRVSDWSCGICDSLRGDPATSGSNLLEIMEECECLVKSAIDLTLSTDEPLSGQYEVRRERQTTRVQLLTVRMSRTMWNNREHFTCMLWRSG